MKKIIIIAILALMAGAIVIKKFLPISGAALQPAAVENYAASADSRGNTSIDIMAAPKIAAVNIVPKGAPGIKQKVMRTAYLSLQVKDVATAVSEITQIAATLNGLVVSSNLSQQDQANVKAVITLKVPEERLTDAINKIHAIAKTIISEQINSDDVTTDYIDLQARLKVAAAAEQQYLQILKQAHKVSEILEVTRQLNTVRSEIESLKGRLNYLENQTSLSAITVELHQHYQAQAFKHWQLADQIQVAWERLITTFKWIIEAGVWLVIYVLPLSLIVLACGLSIRKIVKRWKK